MALVTSQDVQALVPFIAADSLLDPFIVTADLIVQEDLAGQGLSTPRLTQIELYLAAHFALVVFERGGLQSQRVGSASGPQDVYKAIDSENLGFLSTRFGQQAVALDTSNTLLSISRASLKAKFRVSPAPTTASQRVTDNTTGF